MTELLYLPLLFSLIDELDELRHERELRRFEPIELFDDLAVFNGIGGALFEKFGERKPEIIAKIKQVLQGRRSRRTRRCRGQTLRHVYILRLRRRHARR